MEEMHYRLYYLQMSRSREYLIHYGTESEYLHLIESNKDNRQVTGKIIYSQLVDLLACIFKTQNVLDVESLDSPIKIGEEK